MMSKSDPLAAIAADTILNAFERYQARFRAITRRAAHRFATAEWRAMRADAVERLDLYPLFVNQCLKSLNQIGDNGKEDARHWSNTKKAFAKNTSHRKDRELSTTFYNSVIRKRLNIVGADPINTFIFPYAGKATLSVDRKTVNTFDPDTDTSQRVAEILNSYSFDIPFFDLTKTAAMAARRIDMQLNQLSVSNREATIEMLPHPFYRGMGAYLVGRIMIHGNITPLIFALINQEQTIVLDAVLTDEEAVTILFSFTRAYFHVTTHCPSALVVFIHSLLPTKRIAEIYTTLGYHKHGKTELYRELTHHLATCCDDQFNFSIGKRGMVMIVFNMSDDDLVFKVIREKISPPKQTNRQEVMKKYDLVFHHDRAGRLIDAQNFDHLSFSPCCFTPPLIEEMQHDAPDTVHVSDTEVVIEQLYIERRVTPLDIYIQKANLVDAASAIIDYGQAIKDLAASNIFPGDMLLKNFGVTARRRVVFYDYDELMLVTECVFRRMPKARHEEDEMRATPWFFVGKNDVFPEELGHFLGLPDSLRHIFMRHHADLFTAEYWMDMQSRLQDNEPIHIFPYGPKYRLQTETTTR